MHVDPIARASKAAIFLLVTAVSFALFSAVFHSRIHILSEIFLGCAIAFGFLALIKLLNSVADHLPFRFLEKMIHWVHAIVFEVLTLAILPFIHVLRFSQVYRSPTRSNQGKPILLIHGYCNDSSVWFYLRKKLAQENLGPIYTIDLGTPFSSIRDYAQKVREKIGEIEKETGASQITLVGHSMGGLVSSMVAVAPPHPLVTDVITIGSPLGGTHIARIGFGPNAREMERSSRFIEELEQKLGSNAKIRFYHIATKTDQLVIPSHSAHPPTPSSREFVFEDIGHASLLFSPRVASLLVSWLKEISSPQSIVASSPVTEI